MFRGSQSIRNVALPRCLMCILWAMAANLGQSYNVSVASDYGLSQPMCQSCSTPNRNLVVFPMADYWIRTGSIRQLGSSGSESANSDTAQSAASTAGLSQCRSPDSFARSMWKISVSRRYQILLSVATWRFRTCGEEQTIKLVQDNMINLMSKDHHEEHIILPPHSGADISEIDSFLNTDQLATENKLRGEALRLFKNFQSKLRSTGTLEKRQPEQ